MKTLQSTISKFARRVGLTLALVLVPLQALAGPLDEPKARGIVGEQADGYLGAVQNTPEAAALVADINAKRKAEYERIAKANNLQLNAVESLAGKKNIEKTVPGNFVNTDGSWHKK